MNKKLENELYSFEKKSLEELDKLLGPFPGEKVFYDIKIKEILLPCAERLAEVYHKDNAAMREYLKRTIKMKLYPATEPDTVSNKIISQLNKEAEFLYKRIEEKISKLKNDNVKYSALNFLRGAKKYKVKNILE